MSYILDALRKADAEREQGRVPGLHSQLGPTPMPGAPEEPIAAPPAPAPAWPMMAVAGLVGALVAALVLWWALNPSGAETPTAAMPPQAPTPAPFPAAAPPQTSMPSMAPATPRVEPVPAPDLALPQAPAPAPAPTPAPTPAPAPTPVATPAPAAVAVQPLSALPDALRRSLPPLVFGGAMHSDNAASRMLVINNNVYREGDEPATGLVLEQILLKSAVFRYQGQRFSVNY